MVSDSLSCFWSLHMKSKLLLDGDDGAVAPWAAGGIGGQELSSWSGGWAENFDKDSINNPQTWSTSMKAQRCSSIEIEVRLTMSIMWSALWQMKWDLSTSRYENSNESDPFQNCETADLVTANMSNFTEYHRLSQTRIQSASLGSEWAQSLTVLFPYI